MGFEGGSGRLIPPWTCDHHEENSMSDDNDIHHALQAAMDAHNEMFGFCPGPPYGCDLDSWVKALQEAVAAGKAVDTSPFFPTDPDVCA
jgi:hypothetical protein